MRYQVQGVEIRSENAAKPYTQQSRVVVDYLRGLQEVQAVLDFGCGKLRYGDLLAKLGQRVTIVDSQVQLTRHQKILGKRTTVNNLVTQRYSNVEVLPVERCREDRGKYDLVTCINVLSAIPTRAALNATLAHIKRLTRAGGTAVFVNQHRNSYFARFEAGASHLFGYLFETRSGHSYYGVLTNDLVQQLLLRSGFRIRRAWVKGEINFVQARPRSG